MTLEEWRALSLEAQAVWVDGLLERLPEGCSRVGGFSTPVIERDGVRYALIFGGTVQVGVTSALVLQVGAFLTKNPFHFFDPTLHEPVVRVTVPAHFAAVEPVPFEGQRWFLRQDVGKVLELLRHQGVRLPSESEWELQWASYRTLLPSMVESCELCADDWRPDLRELPVDGRSGGTGAGLVKCGALNPELLESVVPARRPLKIVSVVQARPVFDLPLV